QGRPNRAVGARCQTSARRPARNPQPRAGSLLASKCRQLSHQSKIVTASAVTHRHQGTRKWGYQGRGNAMKCSKPVAVAVTEDRAVDIMIYTLGGVSIALALAASVGVLFFSF